MGHAGKFVFGLVGPHKLPVALLVGRAQSVVTKRFEYVDMYIDITSFYEGHSMDLVTFATRVCKLLGVEAMVGELGLSLETGYILTISSHQRSRRTEPGLCRG